MPDFNHDNFMYEEVTKLNDKSIPCNDCVLLRSVFNERSKEINGIILPQQYYKDENTKTAKGEVIALGKDAQNKGLNVGDIVLYDKYSAFCRPGEKVGRALITRFENILAVIKSV
jgi:co-chaperonin GroES (HSP10)